MLVFNPSYDVCTFEEETYLQKWQRWMEFRGQAMYNVEFYLSLDATDMATRYWNLVNRIENKLMTL